MQKITAQLRFVELPPVHTCDGADISPEIAIEGGDAACYAMMVLNPFEPGCSFTCWLIWNIDPVPIIPAGLPNVPVLTSPIHAIQGTNDFGEIGYRGPCPPIGETHRLLFKVYGLATSLDLEPGATKHQLIDAMKGQVVSFGTTEAMYRR